MHRRFSSAIAVSVLLFAPGITLAAGVQVVFDLSTPETGPLPSDRFTVADADQLTGRRLNMPLPDCKKLPSDCDELAVVNELDGFGLLPRLGIPFTGAIDPRTVSSSSVYLVVLGDVVSGEGAGEVVGINQAVWDPVGNRLYAQSDQLLRQHSRYALIVTNGLRDSAGDPVEAGDFGTFRHDLNFGQTHDKELKAYRKALLDALQASGIPPSDVIAASVFTTQSATAVLEKIRDQLKAAVPAAADFNIVVSGRRSRAVFDVADILPRSQNGIVSFQETRTDLAPSRFPAAVVPSDALDIVAGAVGKIAFGKYVSPEYESPEKFFPPVGTRTGVPRAQSSSQIYFNLFLPAETKPPWPVAIFNHGLGANKQAGAFAVASRMASYGIATIAINSPGHGLGERGFLTVATRSEGTFTIPAGGRGIDQNGDHIIDTDEGSSAAAGPRVIISGRDGYRQTVVDTMQLVRVIQRGIDVDGDGIADLDPARIYYFGQSRGGIVGSMFLAVEPDVLVGAMNVPGGPIIDVARLNPGLGLRSRVTQALLARTPTLLNALPIAPPLQGFNENMPLRDEPVRVNDVAGAIELQTSFDRRRWIQGAGDPVAYAPHLRERPLEGVPPKDILVQFARGDMTMPNPTTTALLRAGNLADRATLYRYDLLWPTLPPTTAKNPHNFMPNLTVPATFAQRDLAQTQIAVFFASNGEETIDPDGDGPFFETPVKLPLPEDTAFIP